MLRPLSSTRRFDGRALRLIGVRSDLATGCPILWSCFHRVCDELPRQCQTKQLHFQVAIELERMADPDILKFRRDEHGPRRWRRALMQLSIAPSLIIPLEELAEISTAFSSKVSI